MDVLYYTHPSALRHDAGPGHPENAGRLRAIEALLAAERPGFLVRREAPQATLAQIERAHPAPYPERILAAEPTDGYVRLDPDTLMSNGSAEAALRAAGAGCAAVDAVLAGEARRAFVAMRPPGHHAEPQQAMGFCLFDTVAIAALQARVEHGIGRIAIYDFDVHHGNGTQAIFWDDPQTLYLSTHQMPLYPGTGAAAERGSQNTIVNVPCAAGTGSALWREKVEGSILRRLESFRPELLLVSAGFDAHEADPLAQMRLTEADFAWVTAKLVAVAERHSQGRIVSVLEGGYDPDALARSVLAHLEGLAGTAGS
ncbi:MAG: histone deacetylase family protein [Geminicoccaceae bacterium]